MMHRSRKTRRSLRQAESSRVSVSKGGPEREAKLIEAEMYYKIAEGVSIIPFTTKAVSDAYISKSLRNWQYQQAVAEAAANFAAV